MTKELSTSAEVIAACLCSVGGDILKTDVLGRITVGSAQREAILDAFEASGMTGQAFALHHGIKIQTFASWMQKRRRRRGDYQNEALCRKLRMRKDPLLVGSKKVARPQASMNLIEVNLQNETPKMHEALEVILPGGAVVRIRHESQLGLLQILMRQLTC
ncbi:MAG: IS66 family insertion sequence element accessory protein TnpA [bacterium]|jgi:hypothetical protein